MTPSTCNLIIDWFDCVDGKIWTGLPFVRLRYASRKFCNSAVIDVVLLRTVPFETFAIFEVE